MPEEKTAIERLKREHLGLSMWESINLQRESIVELAEAIDQILEIQNINVANIKKLKKQIPELAKRMDEMGGKLDEIGIDQALNPCYVNLEQRVKKLEPSNAPPAKPDAESEHARLRKLIEWLLNNLSWDNFNDDADGGSLQDKAEELGLIELRPIKPEDSIDGETYHYFCKWDARTRP